MVTKTGWVSIFLRLMLTGVTAWNLGSFFDLSLDVPSFVSPIRMLTVHWFFVGISQWWNRYGVFSMRVYVYSMRG